MRIFHFTNSKVVRKWTPLELWVSLCKIRSLTSPITNRFVSLHQIKVHSVQLFKSSTGCNKHFVLNPLTPPIVRFFSHSRSFCLQLEVSDSNSHFELLLAWKADATSNFKLNLVFPFLGDLSDLFELDDIFAAWLLPFVWSFGIINFDVKKNSAFPKTGNLWVVVHLGHVRSVNETNMCSIDVDPSEFSVLGGTIFDHLLQRHYN